MAETTNRCDDVFADERPWGRFEQFVCNESVTVKIITVNPGERLSLQTHGQRDEMWQILDGPLELQIDDRTSRGPASALGCPWGPGTGSSTVATSLPGCSRSRSGSSTRRTSPGSRTTTTADRPQTTWRPEAGNPLTCRTAVDDPLTSR